MFSYKMKRDRFFDLSLIELQDLGVVTTEEGRYYTTPTGEKYPSVTTILGRSLDKSGLDKWRRAVGEERANQISTQAAGRGSAIHELCERYVLNDLNYTAGAMPINVATFKTIQPLLDEYVGKVYGLELPLYSNTLKTAGRTDLLAEFKGVNSIVDFKTSKKIKKEEWIESYFLQATVYSLMVEERTKIKVPQIVIMIAVDYEDPQLFVKDRDQYVEKVLEIFT